MCSDSPPLETMIRPLRNGGGDSRARLTASQREIWLALQLHPQSAAAFCRGRTLRLEGSLDQQALAGAISDLRSRHEILRASIDNSGCWNWDAHPQHGGDIEVSVVDADSGLAGVEQREMGRAFDLQHDCLLCFHLVRQSADLHHLVAVAHQIAVDRQSLELLLHELAQFYNGRVEGVPVALDGPPRFEDYIRAEQAFLSSAEGSRHIEYWQQQLQSLPAVPRLPVDRVRSRERTFRAAVAELPLPCGLLDSVQGFVTGEGCDLRVALLAAIAALYCRTAAAEDVVVGVPAPGQEFHGLPGLVAQATNLLPVRLRPRQDLSFRALSAQVAEACEVAMAHRGVGYATAEAQAKNHRDPDTPSMGAMLELAHDETSPRFAGLSVSLRRLPCAGSLFDWRFTLIGSGAETSLRCTYSAESYSAEMAQERLYDLLSLLGAGVAEPDRRLDELNLLQPHRRRQVTRDWNATARDYPLELPLHALIARQVALQPNLPAVIGDEGVLSYAELDRRAGQLAQALLRQGAGPGRIVGVCARRDLHLPTALLAVLKCGAAYLPLDPEHPQQRLSWELQDAECPVVLEGSGLDASTAEWLARCGTPCLRIEDRLRPASEEREGKPQADATPDDTAYVIFTSGSTGRPKGVMIGHRGIVNRLLWMQETYPIGPGDRVLLKTPFSFDVSVWEFFWPLMTGAAIVVAQAEGHKNPAYIAELIERQQVNLCHFVPSMLNLFLQQADLPPCASLRQVFCSGEALGYAVTEQFREKLPAARLDNLYGPTEASVDVSYWTCVADPLRQLVPIGRPVANTQLYVLDSRLQPLPVGVAGELFLGGVQLAKGYLKRQDLTTERFIHHPEFGRLYRTGDLARWLPDGVVDYLGRLDGQVKLRGQRIELGEIESCLDALPAIAESACGVREFGPGDQRLLAWVVMRAGAELDPVAVHEALGRSLPHYMVPQLFVPLQAMPRLTSGKINRKALTVPAEAGLRPRVTLPPVTATEQKVARIWCDLLKIRSVNRNDRFFDLGGHSMLAVQVVSALRQEFGVKPSLRSVIMGTLASLALEIERGGELAELQVQAAHADVDTAPRLQQAGYFGPEGRRLFGLLTRPAQQRRSEAVLICQSWGLEYMRSHRALHLLAGRLGEAGYHVLRFDYFGAGDSEGHSSEATPAQWIEDIAAAATYLQRKSGLERLCVIGHRLGALLACAAQSQGRLPGRLLLWDPPASGAQWLRQLEHLCWRVHSLRNEQRPLSTRLRPPTALELTGEVVSEVWRRQISALRCEPRPGTSLLLSSDVEVHSVARPAVVRLPDPAYWNRLDWITRPWNPRASLEQLTGLLDRQLL